MNTATFDKETLLEQIEKKELERLNKLSNQELKDEIEEWFDETLGEGKLEKGYLEDYLDDFMGYRRDSSIEELTEILNNYK